MNLLAIRLYRSKLLILRVIRKTRSAETHELATSVENRSGYWLECALRHKMMRIVFDGKRMLIGMHLT